VLNINGGKPKMEIPDFFLAASLINCFCRSENKNRNPLKKRWTSVDQSKKKESSLSRWECNVVNRSDVKDIESFKASTNRQSSSRSCCCTRSIPHRIWSL